MWLSDHCTYTRLDIHKVVAMRTTITRLFYDCSSTFVGIFYDYCTTFMPLLHNGHSTTVYDYCTNAIGMLYDCLRLIYDCCVNVLVFRATVQRLFNDCSTTVVRLFYDCHTTVVRMLHEYFSCGPIKTSIHKLYSSFGNYLCTQLPG